MPDNIWLYGFDGFNGLKTVGFVVADTDLDTTYYINDIPDGFQCDLWDYYFDDLETIASQLYDEMHGSVTDIRIE